MTAVTPFLRVVKKANEPRNIVATAQCYVQYYSLRWLIERYHYTLKSGCRLQASQLHTHEALQNLLALYCAVAWRLLWLTYAARQDEQQACTVAFSFRSFLFNFHFSRINICNRAVNIRFGC